jgi:hypothetical protein
VSYIKSMNMRENNNPEGMVALEPGGGPFCTFGGHMGPSERAGKGIQKEEAVTRFKDTQLT